MPKKKKVVEETKPEETVPQEEQTDEELTAEVKEKVFGEEAKVKTPKEEAEKPEVKVKKKPKKLPSDIVEVKVLVGSLHWEGGTFQKGEVFKCKRKRASRFEPVDVEILE